MLYAKQHPQPGQVASFKRMTRYEYQNAIRDLLGLEIDGKKFLPVDSSSHGFDNITVSQLSPTLMERYLSAAQKIAQMAIGSAPLRVDGKTYRIKADITQESHVPGLPFGTVVEDAFCTTSFIRESTKLKLT